MSLRMRDRTHVDFGLPISPPVAREAHMSTSSSK